MEGSYPLRLFQIQPCLRCFCSGVSGQSILFFQTEHVRLNIRRDHFLHGIAGGTLLLSRTGLPE